MIRSLSGIALGLAILAATGTIAVAQSESKPAAAPEVLPGVPGIPVGAKAPNVTLQTIDGKSVTLASLLEKGPVVLTFYRGGWCPYCTKSLSNWEGQIPELTAAGASFIAVTLEKPDEITKTKEMIKSDITILGDPTGEAARAFNLLFTVDDATQAKYKGYGIDVAASNSNGLWTLPHPGTFVIDTQGMIHYSFVTADYRFRAIPGDVIAKVKSLSATSN